VSKVRLSDLCVHSTAPCVEYSPAPLAAAEFSPPSQTYSHSMPEPRLQHLHRFPGFNYRRGIHNANFTTLPGHIDDRITTDRRRSGEVLKKEARYSRLLNGFLQMQYRFVRDEGGTIRARLECFGHCGVWCS
jgi:hypothetical protein